MRVKRTNILFSLLVLLCLTLIGCGKTVLFSAWRDRPIKIDGKFTDWNESTVHYDNDTKVVLNLINDADYLYLCLISRNRAIEAKIMESGLTLWFDPDGGQKNEFGIRFPIGLSRMGMSIDDEEKRDIERDWQDQEDKSGLIDREKEKLMDKNFNQRLEALEGLQGKLEIVRLGAGKRDMVKDKGIALGDTGMNKPVELSLEEAGKFGIEAKVGRQKDYFVYELKIPLTKSAEHIYAIEARKGEPIGLGLEVVNFSADIPNDAISDRTPPESDRMPGGRESMFGSVNEVRLWFAVVLSEVARQAEPA